MAKLGVGRSTLRESFSNLIHQGVLYKIQGSGTFVGNLPLTLPNGIDRLWSVTECIKSVGASPSTSRLETQVITAGKLLSEKLQISEKDSCLRIERVRRANDRIAAYCIDVVPLSLLKVEPTREDLEFSLLELLVERGQKISHTHTKLSPVILTRRELPEMSASIGLFILFEEIYFNFQHLPIAYANDYYSSDIFDFQIMRKR